MMFKAAFIALFASVASASVLNPSEGVPADSKLGMNLLRKAQVIEPARHLEQNNNEAQSFIAGYELKYLGCSSLIQVNPEGNQDEGILYTQHLVKFALCPENSCGSCSGGGEYVVNMLEFVDAYTEAKLNEKEMACENIRENCYCDNANDDEVCENSCYSQAGMDSCIEYEGQEEFEIQRYLECQGKWVVLCCLLRTYCRKQVCILTKKLFLPSTEMENNNGNNNNNNQNANNYNNQNGNYYGSLYVGPYCSSDGHSIHLGVFYDQGCTNRADNNLYAKRNYGASLPFSSESLVKRECISCKQYEQNDNNNNNNNGNNNNGNYNYYNYEINEICEQSYETAVKCESGMSKNYKDTTGCDYINNILPRLTSASKSAGVYGSLSASPGGAAKAFAWIFAATTILFGAYAYFLYRKIKRGGAGVPSGNLA